MIAIGGDHAGYPLKQVVKEYLLERGLEVCDFGTDSEESVDYPVYALKVAESVARGECEKGILVCGTGIGVSIAANKVKGIRAALCGDVFSAKASRRHNDANILTLGQRVTGVGAALEIVEAWLEAKFEGGRHADRVNQIAQIEEKYMK